MPTYPQRFGKNGNFTLRILHTNDNEGNASGVARMVGELWQRQQEAPNGGVLTLHAGDMFIGRPTRTSRQTNVGLWNLAKLDALTPGNHDFDDQDAFEYLARYAKFPIVAGNIQLRTSFPNVHVDPIILNKPFGKVGIVGAAFPNVQHKPYPASWGAHSFDVRTSIETVRNQVQQLQAQGVKVIVVLSHMGWKDDLKLAEIPGVDLVIGGHNHVNRSQWVSQKETGGQALVLHTSGRGQTYGLVDAAFTLDGELILGKTKGNLNEVARNTAVPPKCQAVLDKVNRGTPLVANLQTGYQHRSYRTKPNGLAAYFCQKLLGLGALTQGTSNPYVGPPIDIVLLRSDKFKASLPAGPIYPFYLQDVFPFSEGPVVIQITGAQILQVLNNTALGWQREGGDTRTFFPGGLSYTLDARSGEIRDVYVYQSGVRIPLDKNKTYTVLTDFYSVASGKEPINPVRPIQWQNPHILWRFSQTDSRQWFSALLEKALRNDMAQNGKHPLAFPPPNDLRIYPPGWLGATHYMGKPTKEQIQTF